MVVDKDDERGYETRDINLKGVALFVAALAVTLIVVHVIIMETFRFYLAHETRPAPSSFVTAPPAGSAGPGLLVNAPQRLSDIRAQEDQILNNYGWMDPSRGIVRIPIERAMDLMIQRGLPATVGSAPQSSPGAKRP